jgi:hypothetical protein
MKNTIISGLASLALLAGLSACSTEDRPATEDTAPGVEEPKEEKPKKEKPKEEKPKESVSQEQARQYAESYLDMSAFSRKGLIEQLGFEGFSTKDAEYGVDALDADWNEQAAKSAQSYLDMSSFSRKSLIDQLMFEGYTEEQAEYGADQVGLS